MKNTLKVELKRRESLRRFARAILREAIPGWFHTVYVVCSMLQVYQICLAQRSRISRVTYVNGTRQLQTVTRGVSWRFDGVIAAFGELTGVLVVLTARFNEHDPLVCRLAEVRVFGTTTVSRT